MTRRELLKLTAATALVPALPVTEPALVFPPAFPGWQIIQKSGRVLAAGSMELIHLAFSPTDILLRAWDRGEITLFNDEGDPI